ncbi:Cytochrome P450, family 76, subfamily G, polypeptide 1 [Theobroma cacao]|uniref:Cytochrome P450, family 76, subfamily G, polypeptide 1 n=1 Tax=Theobroma cacao TaxID=3641 RepID=A0A061ETW3_THECC|nr:Cytochrome P450, family 76, subfamily G, polypeptide 1 [Theobroma cacao]
MPHQTLYKLKPKYGPVLRLKLGSINTLGTLALGRYGSYWHMDRCICSTKLLVNKRINEMAPLRQKCLDDMMRYIEEDIVAAHAQGQIGKDLLDSGSKKGKELFDAMNKVMEWAGKPILADFFLILKWLNPQGIKKNMELGSNITSEAIDMNEMVGIIARKLIPFEAIPKKHVM